MPGSKRKIVRNDLKAKCLHYQSLIAHRIDTCGGSRRLFDIQIRHLEIIENHSVVNMKMKNILFFFFVFFAICPLSLTSAENAEIDQLLDRVESEMSSQGKFEWQAIILTNVQEFDKTGKSVKETRMKRRTITGRESTTENEILEAIEIENGKTKDITQK